MLIPPPPPPGWLEGPVGLLRAAAILIAAGALGVAIGAVERAARPDTGVAADQSKGASNGH